MRTRIWYSDSVTVGNADKSPVPGFAVALVDGGVVKLEDVTTIAVGRVDARVSGVLGTVVIQAIGSKKSKIKPNL